MPQSTQITVYRFDELSATSQAKAIRSLKKTHTREFIDFAMRREAAHLGFPFAKIRLLKRYDEYRVGIDGVLTIEQTRELANNDSLAERWERPDSRKWFRELQALLKPAVAQAEKDDEFVQCSTYYEGTPFLVDCYNTTDDSEGVNLLHALLNSELLRRLCHIRDEAHSGRFNHAAASAYLSDERWRFLKDGTIAAGL